MFQSATFIDAELKKRNPVFIFLKYGLKQLRNLRKSLQKGTTELGHTTTDGDFEFHDLLLKHFAKCMFGKLWCQNECVIFVFRCAKVCAHLLMHGRMESLLSLLDFHYAMQLSWEGGCRSTCCE